MWSSRLGRAFRRENEADVIAAVGSWLFHGVALQMHINTVVGVRVEHGWQRTGLSRNRNPSVQFVGKMKPSGPDSTWDACHSVLLERGGGQDTTTCSEQLVEGM